MGRRGEIRRYESPPFSPVPKKNPVIPSASEESPADYTGSFFMSSTYPLYLYWMSLLERQRGISCGIYRVAFYALVLSLFYPAQQVRAQNVNQSKNESYQSNIKYTLLCKVHCYNMQEISKHKGKKGV